MLKLWKKHGTSSSLGHMQRRERELIERIERSIDEGSRTGGLIEEIVRECRARAMAQPTEASWRYLLGRFLMAAGSPLEARDELEAAAVLRPCDPRIPAHLAIWYAAAFAACTGEQLHLDLPQSIGPGLTVDARAFASIDERMNAAALSARCTQFADVALRFAMRGSDARSLKQVRASAQLDPIEAQTPTPLAIAPLSRAS